MSVVELEFRSWFSWALFLRDFSTAHDVSFILIAEDRAHLNTVYLVVF